ncbi:MAG TPA: hypothetical protein VGV86_10615 [Acidimicrobiales bacterium]|nr:hypothetical protein [Acidimicrobiales bacterium]
MLRRATVLALAVLAVSCAGTDDKVDAITVDGERVAVAPLVDAHGALCEAANRPAGARALFFDRAHDSLHTVARAVEEMDRAQAAELLEAKEKVEGEIAAAPSGLPEDLLRLAEIYRVSLGRLAIEASPCDK